MCLYEGCKLPYDRLLFERSQDWIDHIRQNHLLKWCCETEEHEEAFDAKGDFMDHLRNFHAGSFADDDIPYLTEMSERSLGRTFDSCPLCGAWDMSDADIEHHVSDHLIELSLLSLPPPNPIQKHQPGVIYDTKRNEAYPGSSYQSRLKGKKSSSPLVDETHPYLSRRPTPPPSRLCSDERPLRLLSLGKFGLYLIILPSELQISNLLHL